MTRPGNSNINGGKNREPHHDCEVGAKIINPLLSATVALTGLSSALCLAGSLPLRCLQSRHLAE